MTDYLYGVDICFDPDNPNNIVRGALIELYDATDLAGTTLLALKDTSGNPIPNPMMSNEFGAIGRRIAQVPQCLWKSGPYSGEFSSYKGLRDEALAARGAAEQAVESAENAAAAAAGAATSAAAAATGAATSAAGAAAAQLETAKAAATSAASSAATALAEASAARAAAEDAAAVTAGGGFAVDPANPNVLLISTLEDGTVAVDPTNPNVLLITT